MQHKHSSFFFKSDGEISSCCTSVDYACTPTRFISRMRTLVPVFHETICREYILRISILVAFLPAKLAILYLVQVRRFVAIYVIANVVTYSWPCVWYTHLWCLFSPELVLGPPLHFMVFRIAYGPITHPSFRAPFRGEQSQFGPFRYLF